MPYAGSTAPTGYLLCDGSEVPIASYQDLYGVIGTTYGTGVNPNTFKLPDLRGRFALGKDNMDNNLTVQDTDNNAVDAGGGSAGRVTDTSAESLGGSAGDELKDITDNEIGQGTQYTNNTGTGVYSNINVMNPYLTLNYIIRALS
jgi:microcystin-dependent protein